MIPDGLSFGGALVALKHGSHVARHAWEDKTVHLVLTKTETCEADTHISVTVPNNTLARWIPSQENILAEDWYIGGEM